MSDVDPRLVAEIERVIGGREGREMGGRIRFLCPAHDDHRPSADWHMVKHVWTCRSCGAGGGAIDLARRLEIELPERPEPTPIRPERPVVVATYDYTDERGNLLYQSVRYKPKTFRQRRPDGKGDWIWNVAEVRRVPYNLPGLMAAGSDPWALPTVYIVEGERDADRLNGLGCVATTNVGGAGKWTDDLSVYLSDRNVVILPDNDDPGRRHATMVATSLAAFASSARIIELPGLPEKGDVSDWLDAGHTIADLERTVLDAESAERSGRLQLLTPAELLQRPQPRWIVEDVLVEDSLACIVGPPGTFKSFIALSLHFAIASGSDWHGRNTVPGSSVYVIAEGVRGMVSRVMAWEGYSGQSAPDNARFVAEPLQLANGNGSERLLEAVTVWGNTPKLVIFDTLARTAVGLEENSAKDMGLLIAGAEHIRRETGACVLFIHHGTRAAGTPRGSSALDGAFDTLLNVTRENDIITVACTKQKDAGEFHRFRLVPRTVQIGNGENSIVLDVSTLGEDVNRSSSRAFRVLQDTFGDTGATTTEWLTVIKAEGSMSESTFYRARKSLLDTGKVVVDNTGRGGRYRPTGTPRLLSAGD